MLDPTFAEAIRARVRTAPFARWMGFEVAELGDGRSELRLRLGEHHLNPGGTAHGGVAASLLDSAIGLALRTRLAPGATHATLQLHVTYLRPASGGTLIARARAVHSGARIEYGEGTLHDDEDRLLATGSATFVVRGGPGNPSVRT